MRRQYTSMITESTTDLPPTYALRPIQPRRSMRRVTRGAAVVLGCGLCLGLLLLLLQPNAWLPPSTRATEQRATTAEPSAELTRSVDKAEALGMIPAWCEEDLLSRC
jgi:ferric-dicitrate binding protein FerR (iron transport regulator)